MNGQWIALRIAQWKIALYMFSLKCLIIQAQSLPTDDEPPEVVGLDAFLAANEVKVHII